MGIRETRVAIYDYLVFQNEYIKADYARMMSDNPDISRKDRWKGILRFNYKYRIRHEIPSDMPEIEIDPNEPIRYFLPEKGNPPIEETLEKLMTYEVVSFDIFDTAIVRNVSHPHDIFRILAFESGRSDFHLIRKKAEKDARYRKEISPALTREVTLAEIYDVMEQYSIDRSWMQREIELELSFVEQNPYVHQIWQALREAGKKTGFTSDMYLSREIISVMLQKCGYADWDFLYISNEYGINKGGAELQKVLTEEWGESVIHVGDNEDGDYNKSLEAGIAALHLPVVEYGENYPDMGNTAGSIYKAFIKNRLLSPAWDKDLQYEHGFRTGGILVYGFCAYIDELAKKNHADKILFCARDCDIVHQAYKRFWGSVDSEYIQISRHAIFTANVEHYLYDYAERYFLRYVRQYRNSKTLGTILEETGLDYLIPYLEDNDLEQYAYPFYKTEEIEQFIWDHKDVIEAHNREHKHAAKKYFDGVFGDAKKVLVVDIGWSGTCILALQDFMKTEFPDRSLNVRGVLMFSSRNETVTSAIENGDMDVYVSSPFLNMDITRSVMPGRTSTKRMDMLHMPIEYLFTSAGASCLTYEPGIDSGVTFAESKAAVHANRNEILSMQQGVLDFIDEFSRLTAWSNKALRISPYTAFSPLQKTLGHIPYLDAVYGNFSYDAFTPPYAAAGSADDFRTFLGISKKKEPAGEEPETERSAVESGRQRILFVTPELTYTGTPRSLLRMCRVARDLGYEATVWSAVDGPFSAEYQALDIPVRIVPEEKLYQPGILAEIASFDMAVCNTISSDGYAAVCSRLLPTVWYIREATNIPDFIIDNPKRKFHLETSKDIYCVSDYAKAAIEKYTKNEVHVVQNCVEDEIGLAADYWPGSGETVKFVQFGTMEYRKGYDVLVEAYFRLPEAYQKQCELYFAGGFINSGMPYCAYLFNKIKDCDSIHYLGVVKGEPAKIQTLSSMDVVVVASRDESCSLVALEGAMLSKPLIVTQNVGAKYIIHEDNGFVVETGDPDSLRDAMMAMIDKRTELARMGEASRGYYEQQASMEKYTEDMKALFSKALDPARDRRAPRSLRRKETRDYLIWSRSQGKDETISPREKVIVSITSHPSRMETIVPCIKSLINQKTKPEKIFLWLSEEQFPNKNADLPKKLTALQSDLFTIRWVEEDLKPHKKYFYVMQEFPDYPVIIADDDVEYSNLLVHKLMKSYKAHPDCVSCMRTNLITFGQDGSVRGYNRWRLDYKNIRDRASAQLLAVGVGGVLYPPHSVPAFAFNKEAILENCLFVDDLWLKFCTYANGYKVILPMDRCEYREIENSQETALWKLNVNRNNNTESLKKILAYFDENIVSSKELLETMRKDYFC